MNRTIKLLPTSVKTEEDLRAWALAQVQKRHRWLDKHIAAQPLGNLTSVIAGDPREPND